MKQFIPPFHIMPIPINKAGDGPECDESKVVHILYEVWDSVCQTVSSSNTEEAAKKSLAGIRVEYGVAE